MSGATTQHQIAVLIFTGTIRMAEPSGKVDYFWETLWGRTAGGGRSSPVPGSIVPYSIHACNLIGEPPPSLPPCEITSTRRMHGVSRVSHREGWVCIGTPPCEIHTVYTRVCIVHVHVSCTVCIIQEGCHTYPTAQGEMQRSYLTAAARAAATPCLCWGCVY